MSLPTFEKTYESVINTTVGSTSSGLADCRDTLFKLVSVLLGLSNVPCTVWGSSDSTNVNNGGGTNYWTNASKLIWDSNGSPHSWIVLNFPGIGPKAQLCIDLNTFSNVQFISLGFTMTGYGLANGGTDGTTTNRPTASDSNTYSSSRWGGVNAAWTGKLHVWHSTDGEVTRIFIHRAGVLQGQWLIEKPKNPCAAWTDPHIFSMLGDDGSTPMGTFAHMCQGFNIVTRNGGVSPILCNAYEAFGSSGVPYSAPVSFTGNMDIPAVEFPITPSTGLWSMTTGKKGKWGYMYDSYFGMVAVTAAGDSYPLDGTCQAYQMGSSGAMIMPGDGTSTALQVA